MCSRSPTAIPGDNMALTLQAVLEALQSLDGRQVDEGGRQAIVDAVAHAALMGARGNSGVILSQIVSGAAQVLAERRVSSSTRSWCAWRC